MTTRALPIFALFLVAAPVARAQCPAWKPGFALSGADNLVWSAKRFDDGAGARLFVGGEFFRAGEVVVRSSAAFDGAHWSAVGTMTGPVYTHAVYDAGPGGNGPELYAGGMFTTGTALRIARWNGSTWSPLGLGVNGNAPSVRCLAVYDPGTGPVLAVGGLFNSAGGVSGRNSVATWNGTTWSALGLGVNNVVQSLCAFDDGTGNALYAAGYFSAAGGVLASNVARWDGASWSPLGSGTNEIVYALAVHDDGTGPALYAAGAFTSAGGVATNRIARWDGSSWSAVGAGFDAPVFALVEHDDGGGRALYAGGQFTHSGATSASRVARWSASSGWSGVGEGFDSDVLGLSPIDDATGPALCASGAFTYSGGKATHRIAVWRGVEWRPVETTGYEGLTNAPLAATVIDEGQGPRVLVGGSFADAGSEHVRGIATWDGARWSSIGSGLGGISSTSIQRLLHHDDGGGDAVYALGSFTSIDGVAAISIARRANGAWEPVGGGLTNGSGLAALGRAMVAFDDGSGVELFVAGDFVAAGGIPAAGLARWDGTAWSAVSGGLVGQFTDLAVVAVGGAAKLYACGLIGIGAGPFPWRLYERNGASWTAIASSLSPMSRMTGFDSGAGEELYLGRSTGGAFNGQTFGALVRWDGSAWSNVGGFVSGQVFALERFDDGSGPSLYAGGVVSAFGTSGIQTLAQWDGQGWGALGLGVTGQVNGLAALDDGSGGGPDLYVMGALTTAGGKPSVGFAEWLGCGEPAVVAFCSGDGSGSACPCGNAGAPGHGCANSGDASGALLASSGSASVASDSLVLLGSQMRNGSALYLQGSARDGNGAGSALFDGLRCVTGSIVRLGVESNVGGASQYPAAGQTPIAQRGAVPIAGGQRFYQAWYRDASAAFCPPDTANWTNGLAVSWYP